MVTVYGKDGCAHCFFIEKMLEKKNIEHKTIHDQEKVVKFGRENNMLNMPFVDVNGKIMDFTSAKNWIMGE